MATLVGWQLLIRDVSREYHIIIQSISLIFIKKNSLISFEKSAFAEIYRAFFTGKSVKQFYRFTGKFSVKAQP
jgi:hypothetical protein